MLDVVPSHVRSSTINHASSSRVAYFQPAQASSNIMTGNDRAVPSFTDIQFVERNLDNLGIKYDQVAQPPWFRLNTRTSWKLDIASKVYANAKYVGRALSQDETDALAEHVAQAFRYSSYCTPLAAGIGYGAYRMTAHSFAFPWLGSTRVKRDLDVFPGPLGFLRGKHSRLMWRQCRLAAWMFSSLFVVGLVKAPVIFYLYNSRYKSDPRLKDYRQEVMEKSRYPTKPQRVSQPPYQSYSRPGAPQGLPIPIAPKEQHQDSYEQYIQEAPSREITPQAARPQNMQAAQAAVDEDPFAFDDESPVAPAQQRTAQYQYSQQGSAWDRVRNQARAGQHSQSQQSGSPAGIWGRKFEDAATSQGAQQGTSYNYSAADEERASAKGQSQREFDEMLERERRGNPRDRV